MREILFRGKCNEVGKYNGRWIEGFYAEDDNKPIIVRSTGPGFGYFCEPNSIGQYTGLTDKNGKKIFEGDICRFDNGEPDESERYTNYAVQWDCVNCRYVVVDAYNREDCLDIFFAKHAEVIGNIYDNPELLEVEK